MDTPFNLDPDLISLGDSGHGGDVWSASRNLGVPVSEILDLSASLNPLGQPPGLTSVVVKAMELLCHYPDRSTLELRQALAAALGVTPANILPGNGSTALIRVVARAMDLRNIVLLAPLFGEFARSLAITGRHFSYLILKEKNGFAPTMQDLDRLWDMDPSCVVLTNPVSPSGALVEPEVLNSLMVQANRRKVWVVLDEAFIDFAPLAAREWSPPLLQRYPRLLVMRSMTKFYCLAGLRLGYALGHSDTMANLAPLSQAWSVNTLAQKAGVYCLGLAATMPKKPGRRWSSGGPCRRRRLRAPPGSRRCPARPTTCSAACPRTAPRQTWWPRPRPARACWCGPAATSWVARPSICARRSALHRS